MLAITACRIIIVYESKLPSNEIRASSFCKCNGTYVIVYFNSGFLLAKIWIKNVKNNFAGSVHNHNEFYVRACPWKL